MQIIKSTISGARVERLDYNSPFIFEEELRAYRNDPLKCVESELMSFKLFSPVFVQAGQETYTYRMNYATGKAKKTQGKGQDIPKISVGSNKYSTPIVQAKCQIEYTEDELAVDRLTRRNIVSDLIDGATRANYYEINNTTFVGDSVAQVPGLLNNPYIDSGNFAGNAAWSTYTTATATSIFNDVQSAYNKIIDNSTGIETLKPNVMALSPMLYAKIDTTPMNTTNSMTLKQQMETTFGIRCYNCAELNKAFAGGKDGFVLFNNFKNFVFQILGDGNSIFNIQKTVPTPEGWTNVCSSTYGGLVIVQPKAFAIRIQP